MEHSDNRFEIDNRFDNNNRFDYNNKFDFDNNVIKIRSYNNSHNHNNNHSYNNSHSHNDNDDDSDNDSDGSPRVNNLSGASGPYDAYAASSSDFEKNAEKRKRKRKDHKSAGSSVAGTSSADKLKDWKRPDQRGGAPKPGGPAAPRERGTGTDLLRVRD